MTTTTIRSEETSSDYIPPSVFNIAEAFPEELDVYPDNGERLRQWIQQNQLVILCGAAALLGLMISRSRSKY